MSRILWKWDGCEPIKEWEYNKRVHVWITVSKKVGSKEKRMGKEDKMDFEIDEEGNGLYNVLKWETINFCAPIYGASWDNTSMI